jgi:hypothetical protein
MKMTGMRVTPKSTKVTNEGYFRSKTSAIKKTMIVIYMKILNILDFLFSESFSKLAVIIYPLFLKINRRLPG